ncbi:MAG: NifB/NifX family molybdenum-iron cluster-binding protein [Acidobacteria bacterium]|nr:NifB/NifX family molybdenum-iron cluster-binding protein [Acidobacteriota bacterium]
MRLCIPVNEDNGIESSLSGHVGSAEGFMIWNSDDKSLKYQNNSNQHHAHGQCMPILAVGAGNFDAFVVQGIGRRAYALLKEQGIGLYRCEGVTVKDILDAYDAGKLESLDEESCCGGHGHHDHH